MNRLLLLVTLTASFAANAIVVRHDVDDAKYRAAPADFPALVDVPGEGHGVLIAPQWVLTAAHVVASNCVEELTIGGKPRKVKRLVIHPGYKPLPEALAAQAMKTGDGAEATKLLASSDDIALVQLAEPVTDIEPALLYKGTSERGMLVRILGKGATGSGEKGETPHSPHRQALRHAHNQITSAEGRWIGYVFDQPDAALPLEGMSGGGDSGGPVLLEADGKWQVAGLTAWKLAPGDWREFKPGLYGQTANNIRVSHYRGWIDSVIQADTAR